MAAALPTGPSLSEFEAEAAAKRTAAWLSIAVASFLIALKLVGGLVTDSVSMWASLLDSALDVFVSSVNFLAVRAAARPPDEDHSYGHGKAESLAGLFQALAIIASALYLIREAVIRLMHPETPQSPLIGIAITLTAVIISSLLVARLRKVAKAADSPALSADALHYVSDIYTNLGVLIALGLTALVKWPLIDPLISLLISAYIIRSAVMLAKEAVDVLMDRRLPDEVDEQVANVIANYHEYGVRGFHNLRTRRSGSYKFIDLHLEVDRTLSLEAGHEATVKVLRGVEAAIPRSIVQIHTDPWD